VPSQPQLDDFSRPVGRAVPPKLPGCYTQASYLITCQTNIEEAIQVYLEMLDKDRSRTFSDVRRLAAVGGHGPSRLKLLPHLDLTKVAKAAGFEWERRR
jgi:hypothetical protein